MAERSYSLDDLRTTLNAPPGLESYVLIPIMDRVFENWTKQLPNSEITDIHSEYHSSSQIYYSVAMGKIVRIIPHMQDLDYLDQDETWSFVNRITLDGQETPVDKVRENIDNFAKSKSLNDWRLLARAELSTGKTYHLSPKISKFYFSKD